MPQPADEGSHDDIKRKKKDSYTQKVVIQRKLIFFTKKEAIMTALTRSLNCCSIDTGLFSFSTCVSLQYIQDSHRTGSFLEFTHMPLPQLIYLCMEGHKRLQRMQR